MDSSCPPTEANHCCSERVVRSVGLVCALHKPGAVAFARRLLSRLTAAGITVLTTEELAEVCRGPHQVRDGATLAADADLVVAMGGDGTLLTAAHHAAPAGTPLLGVDLGSFGFLAGQPPEAVLANLEELLAGHYEIEYRLMVEAQIRRDGQVLGTYLALNDLVIAKTCPGRMIRLQTEVDGELVAHYPSDGLIIATPTGSTAYNLSAAGPVVSPLVDCLIINPICPHTLYSRPLIVRPSAVITVSLKSQDKPAVPVSLAIDGQEIVDLSANDIIVATQASCKAALVKMGPDSFYQRLRTKLRWGAER